jgi:hypothetical protein
MDDVFGGPLYMCVWPVTCFPAREAILPGRNCLWKGSGGAWT